MPCKPPPTHVCPNTHTTSEGEGDLLDDFVLAATEMGPEPELGPGGDEEGGTDSEYSVVDSEEEEEEGSSYAGSEGPPGAWGQHAGWARRGCGTTGLLAHSGCAQGRAALPAPLPQLPGAPHAARAPGLPARAAGPWPRSRPALSPARPCAGGVAGSQAGKHPARPGSIASTYWREERHDRKNLLTVIDEKWAGCAVGWGQALVRAVQDRHAAALRCASGSWLRPTLGACWHVDACWRALDKSGMPGASTCLVHAGAPCTAVCGPGLQPGCWCPGVQLTRVLPRPLPPALRFEHLALEYDDEEIGDLEEQGGDIRGFADVKGGRRGRAARAGGCQLGGAV